jgi:hypothetical protein
MLELKREVLFGELLLQMESGSLLISGAPGIGKSWLIGRLLAHLKASGRFVLPLIAEEYEVASLEELQRSLGLKTGLESLLASRDKAVLLLDGLDALRAESSQRVFRDLILGVLKRAPNVTVVASIRSFDLAESPVFSSLTSFIPGLGKPFSTITVGPLSDEEIAFVRRDRTSFEELWSSANADTRQLLRTPFNLVIALALLKEGFLPTQLSGIGSQVALLEEFWKRRVDGAAHSLERKRVLSLILERMIAHRTLSIAEVELPNLTSETTLRDLLSLELLRKNTTGRIFFAHNILFDYALARLMLDEVRLEEFLAVDSNRSLFYRPSLNFFFGHVWLSDRSLFWRIVRHSAESRSLPESIGVVPAVVVCQMADDISDLAPLHEDSGLPMQTFLRKVLIGLQAIGVPVNRRQPWIDLALILTSAPQLVFLNELFSVLGVLKDSMRSNERLSLNRCARSLIEWSWSCGEKTGARRAELVGVVTGRTLPIVLQTLADAPQESRKLMKQIIERIGQPGASSRELFWIANDIHLLVEFEPTLAASFYEAVYGHKEDSEDSVSIGSGSVLNLLSTERQQYESLFYQLSARFQTLLKRDFAVAARTAVRITNIEVFRERTLSERDQLVSVKMRVAHRLISYMSDWSEIWDSGGGRDYTSLQMFQSALHFVKENEGQQYASVITDITFAEGVVAVLYKQLFEVASRSIEQFSEALKPALLSARFISAPEVTIAVGELIQQLAKAPVEETPFWSSLEQTILRIPISRPLLRYEKPRSIQVRLLGCFSDRLQDRRARELLESSREQRPNRPFFRMTGGGIDPNSPEIYRMRGIDPNEPVNQRLIAATEAVKGFAYRPSSPSATIEDVDAIFPKVLELSDVIDQSDGASADLFANARGTMNAVVSAMTQVRDIKVDSPVFTFMVGVALAGAADPEPVFDPKYHMPFDSPGWGSPSTRIEAAQAIVNLTWNFPQDQRALPAFRRLVADPVPAVRFQIARGLVALYVREETREEFWETLGRMLKTEPTSGVVLGLLQSLGQIAGREPARTMAILSDYIEHNYRQSERSDVMRMVVGIAVGLYLAQGTPTALSLLRHFEQDFEKYQRELSQMVFAAGQQITPVDGTEPQRKRAREIWNGVLETVLRRSEELHKQKPPRDFQAVVHVLDSLISRLFFSFDLIGTRAPNQNALDPEGRQILFHELKEFIEKLVQADAVEDDADAPLIPHSAHYFLQLMNGILEFAPDDVLHYAYTICKRGARTGYLEDSMARSEAVNLVEKALADYRDRIKNPTVARSLNGLLNLFTEHAWPEAVTLTFRLEDAFR